MKSLDMQTGVTRIVRERMRITNYVLAEIASLPNPVGWRATGGFGGHQHRQLSQRRTRTFVRCGCGSLLAITPVNVSKCTNIGGPWHTSLVCSNPLCRHTELSEKSLTEWATGGQK